MTDDFRPAPRPAKSPQTATNQPAETKTTNQPQEAFRTPEEVAAAQTIEPVAPSTKHNLGHTATNNSVAGAFSNSPRLRRWRDRFALGWPPGKKEYIVAAAVIVLLGASFVVWHVAHPAKPATIVKPKLTLKPVQPAATTVPSTLTGLPVNPSVNKLPVTGVMIENSTFARPQAGLGQAGVVFEAIAEGGITRFLALFQDTSPANVGPIRSARPYYEQWDLGFDAAYAHVGGSPEALSDITSWGVRDLNQFYNGNYYHRVTTREAPHNVYTGIPTLQQLETQKGFASSTFTGFPRKTAAPTKKPTAAIINFTLSGPDYNVKYIYDAPTNSYERFEGGAPHIEANTNAQIAPKIVIAMVMHYSLEPDGYHSDYNVIGSGPAYVFQDGTVTIGQWSKSSNASQITFTTANGAPIKLDAGTTWLTAVAGTNDVTYTPAL